MRKAHFRHTGTVLLCGILLCRLLAHADVLYAEAADESTQEMSDAAPEGGAEEATGTAEEVTGHTAEQDADGPADAAGTGASEMPLQPQTTQTVISMAGKYDSADIAPVVRVNEAQQTITLHNHDIGRNYTLSYDGYSRVTDAYGRDISPGSLTPGTLVDVTFLKSSKTICSMKIASGNGVFVLEEQRDYKLPVKLSAIGISMDAMATVAGDKYLMDVRTLVIVDGKESNPYSILEGDTITVCGVDREIYAVIVTRGHGYLRLSSDTVNGTSLVGAWIELDNSVIRRISPQMLMTAPEGEYTMYIIGNGADYSAPLTITRGRETIVDTSVIPIEPPKTGNIRFAPTPENATVRVDGVLVETGDTPIALTYGIHVLELSAEGYETMVRYLRVGSPSALVRLTLTPDGSAQNTSSDSSDTSGADDATTDETDSTGETGTTGGSGATGTTSGTGATGTTGTTSGTGATSGTGTTSGTGATGTTGTTNGTGTTGTTGQTSGNTGATGGSTTGTSVYDTGNTGTQPQQPAADPSGTGTLTGYRVYVDAPAGAKLFVDGYYIGVVPASFEKVPGIHTVTLSGEGYNTISYNIDIGADEGDKTFRFSQLSRPGDV